MPSGNVPIQARMAGVFVAFGYEVLTVTTAVKTLSASEYVSGDKKAQQALITVETNGINYTLEGTDASATVGHNIAAGGSVTITGYANIANLKMYRSAAADATVKVTYFG